MKRGKVNPKDDNPSKKAKSSNEKQKEKKDEEGVPGALKGIREDVKTPNFFDVANGEEEEEEAPPSQGRGKGGKGGAAGRKGKKGEKEEERGGKEKEEEKADEAPPPGGRGKGGTGGGRGGGVGREGGPPEATGDPLTKLLQAMQGVSTNLASLTEKVDGFDARLTAVEKGVKAPRGKGDTLFGPGTHEDNLSRFEKHMSKLPLEATQRLMVYYSRISLGELKYDKWGAMCWAGVISGYTGGLEDFSDDDAAAAVHLIPDLMKRALSAANAAKLRSNIGAIRNAASKHMVFNLLGVPPDHPGRGTGTGNIMWEATGAEKKGEKWVSLQQHKAISAVAEKWLELISEEVLKQKQTTGDLPLVQTCLKGYAGNADLDSVYANFVFLKSPSPVELAALCAVPALSPQLRKFVPTTETLAASVFTSTQGYCKKADGAGHVRVKYEEGEPQKKEFTVKPDTPFKEVARYVTIQEVCFFLACLESVLRRDGTFLPSLLRERSYAYVPLVEFYWGGAAKLAQREVLTMSMAKRQKVIREMREENLISPLLVSPFTEPKYFTEDCLGRMGIILEKQPEAVSQAQEGEGEESEEEEAAEEEKGGEVSFSM